MKAIGLLLALILDAAIPKLIMGMSWVEFVPHLNGGNSSTLAWIMVAVMLVVIGIGISVPDTFIEKSKKK